MVAPYPIFKMHTIPRISSEFCDLGAILMLSQIKLALSPGPLRGGEMAWYTLNVHAPTFSVKFAIKLNGYFSRYVAK